MDGEAFFDRLYSEYYVHFPCYAVVRADGRGFVTEPAEDGTEALVLLTDDHLAEQHIAANDALPHPAVVGRPDLLARLLRRLPAAVTHVTFDPGPLFHRRYPIELIRASLAPSTERAG